jgi:hypothetical protein
LKHFLSIFSDRIFVTVEHHCTAFPPRNSGPRGGYNLTSAARCLCLRLAAVDSAFDAIKPSERLLGRQTLYCLSRPNVSAGAMLVLMPQLDGADPKLLSCETPTHLNVDAEKLDFLMNTILCI